MIRNIREAKQNEEGFTLIELLVVVIIIGILAAIAIPVFLNQRQSAYSATAESDARNAAIEVETFFTSGNAYPTAAEFATLITDGDINPSTGVTLTYTPGGQTYTISADHNLLDPACDAYYDSAAGGITACP